MKGKIVLMQFPFDDLSSSKVRPAYCLTNTIGKYQHIIFALITSRIPENSLHTDIILRPENPDFIISGLRKSSTIRLDHLVTLQFSLIQRELGLLSLKTQTLIADILCNILHS
ncbi:type II toxin-antitoxin system PemK/MazF family toxin [Anabaena sp. UHCC 0253]|uniref:type II toxin-antitoxin system PemK/MazF family toxin n=1 Tax=Anabaena sp. UHCC 0253 TaxID=2590019 RepID=UPI0014485E3C|nr:type II toxin-antitoxin system PemK/MazF family toxin [Anabaena sp. UHCC 0253]MTJ52435.1 type II toxin-antitoxin system PemK/MazF family toxin [Anabaena sp. UHCC 0253]